MLTKEAVVLIKRHDGTERAAAGLRKGKSCSICDLVSPSVTVMGEKTREIFETDLLNGGASSSGRPSYSCGACSGALEEVVNIKCTVSVLQEEICKILETLKARMIGNRNSCATEIIKTRRMSKKVVHFPATHEDKDIQEMNNRGQLSFENSSPVNTTTHGTYDDIDNHDGVDINEEDEIDGTGKEKSTRIVEPAKEKVVDSVVKKVVKSAKCKICGRAFSGVRCRGNLKRHMKNFHEDNIHKEEGAVEMNQRRSDGRITEKIRSRRMSKDVQLPAGLEDKDAQRVNNWVELNFKDSSPMDTTTCEDYEIDNYDGIDINEEFKPVILDCEEEIDRGLGAPAELGVRVEKDDNRPLFPVSDRPMRKCRLLADRQSFHEIEENDAESNNASGCPSSDFELGETDNSSQDDNDDSKSDVVDNEIKIFTSHQERCSPRYTADKSTLYGKNFKCLFCERKYSYEKDLKVHLKRFHSGIWNPNTHCSMCREEFGDITALKEHRKIHVATVDEKVMESMKEKRKRYSQSTLYGKNLKCLFCEKICIYERTLQIHLRQFHSAIWNPNTDCSMCPKKFGDIVALRKHRKIHVHVGRTGNKTVKCEICGLIFSGARCREKLSLHVRRHRRARKLCTTCGKSFTHSAALKSHREIVCNPDKKEAERVKAMRVKKYRLYKEKVAKSKLRCKICKALFISGTNLKFHLDNVHKFCGS